MKKQNKLSEKQIQYNDKMRKQYFVLAKKFDLHQKTNDKL